MDFRKHVDRILNKATSVFGEEVTHYPKAGGIQTVNAVFDSAYQVVDPDTQEVVSTNKPGLGVNLNDFTSEPIQGDEFEVRGIRLRVTDKREDGQGGAILLLNKVRASDRIDDTRAR